MGGLHLVDFKLFAELADQVNEIVQYTPPHIEHTTRQDVLAHVEYSLKSHITDDTLTPSINDLSAKRALEESKMLGTRERLRSLGLPWLPPRRSQIPMHPPLRTSIYSNPTVIQSSSVGQIRFMSSPSFQLADIAYTKIILHTLKHPHQTVNGVLLGVPAAGRTIDIVDTVPLQHHWTNLSPMMEAGLGIVR